MVMEFVRGETLQTLSERARAARATAGRAHLLQILDALTHAHRAGIVHRDLKPANVMVTDTGMVKVMDFGIARMLGGEHLTHAGYMMGTPAYMAPEQVLGQEIDGRADLYAVGVLFYRLLSRELPFKADTAIAMAQKQVADRPDTDRQLPARPTPVVRGDHLRRRCRRHRRIVSDPGSVSRRASTAAVTPARSAICRRWRRRRHSI